MSRKLYRRVGECSRAFVLSLLGVLLVALPGFCRAATLTVTNTSDTGVAGDGSLRGEIAKANADKADDTITFNIPGTGPFTITLDPTKGFLTITSSMRIVGGTTQATGITISGNNATEIIFVSAHVKVTLGYLTLQDGDGPTAPGAILDAGDLTVNNCTLANNSMGAIWVRMFRSTLVVTSSTFSGNTAAPSNGGAAIFAGTDTKTTVTNSTFFDNRASFGSGDGGAIHVSGFSFLNLKGNILVGNRAGSGAAPSCSTFHGTINDDGYNIADDSSCSLLTSTTTTKGTSQIVAMASDVLDTTAGLTNNGGPTQTIALQMGSSAIDFIPVADCPKVDQRGFIRPDSEQTSVENRCDAGAYESGAVAPFAGQPGTANCSGESDSLLRKRYGGLREAASALDYPNVDVLKAAILEYCEG